MRGHKIDIGCGAFKKEGFLGVDSSPSAGVDYVVNLEIEPLPFPDRSCEYIYSSHCLEHLSNPNHLFNEIGRVSQNGARVEFWVPYAHHNDALLLGHVQYYTEEFWNHVCVQHADFWHTTFGGYWLWKEVVYVIPERIKLELDRLNVDLNFAIRHLNNIVKEISFEFEFSVAKPALNVLPNRKYTLGRNKERHPLPKVDDPAGGTVADPDCRDFTSLTVGFMEPHRRPRLRYATGFFRRFAEVSDLLQYVLGLGSRKTSK
jgi:predicted SAM-dependent methyltransferase